MRLVKEYEVDRLAAELAEKINNQTTQQELFEMTKKLIIKAINSIDIGEMTEQVSSEMVKELRRRGVSL